MSKTRVKGGPAGHVRQNVAGGSTRCDNLSQPRIPTCDNLPIDTIREKPTESNTCRKIFLELTRANDKLKVERKGE